MFGKTMNVNEFYRIQSKCRNEGLNLGRFQGTAEFAHCDWPERMKKFITVEAKDHRSENILKEWGFAPV